MARLSAAKLPVLFFLRHAEPDAAPWRERVPAGLLLCAHWFRTIYWGPLRVPEWRNWQTRGTQNPVPFTGSVGSIPSSGTKVPLRT